MAAPRQSAGIPSLRGSTIDELRTEVDFWLKHLANNLDIQSGARGTPTFSNHVDLQGNRLTNVAIPTTDTDAQQAGNSLGLDSASAAFDAKGRSIRNLPRASEKTQAVPYEQLTEAMRGTLPSDGQFLMVANDARLTQERALAVESAVLTLTDGGANGSLTISVTANGITDAKLRQGAATTVIGRSANSTGNVADIAASGDGQVLLQRAGALLFAVLNIASEITGTLAVGNGGTGQTTATAAFDALDPLTTKGDVIVHNGTNSIRVAVGSNGQLLVADSGTTPGVAWKGTPQSYSISNGTTDRSYDADATTTDELADCLYTLIQDLKSFGILS